MARYRLLLGLVVALGLGASACDAASTPDAQAALPSGTVLFSDAFNRPDGLITNEFAYFNPSLPSAVQSPDWELTSGSFFTRSRSGWSGVPDDVNPDARSSNGTDSAVFRLTTKRADFGNVGVAFNLRFDGFGQTAKTPPVNWDGVHIFLRYQNEESLYYASIDRRDGATSIKKKVPGGPSNGGTYHELATGRHAVPVGAWERVRATIGSNNDGSVTIKLYVGSTLVASAVDRGTGGPPITRRGKVGIRGDNAEFDIGDFRVTAL